MARVADKYTLLLLNGSSNEDSSFYSTFLNLPSATSLPAVSTGPNMASLGYKGCYYFNANTSCTFTLEDTVFTEENFCIEWWELPTKTTQATHSQVLGLNTQGSTYQGLLLRYNNTQIYGGQATSSWDIFNGVTLSAWNGVSTTGWTHYALDKKGVEYYLYKNGVVVWQGAAPSGVHPTNKGLWYLCYNWSGYITGLRISKTSRYTTSFTPKKEFFY